VLHTDGQVLVESHTVNAFEVVGPDQVEEPLEVAVDDEGVGPPVALGALPPLVLVVSGNVAVDVEALEVSAEVPSGRDADRGVGDRALELDVNLLGCLGLDLLEVLLRVSVPALLEEANGSLQALLWLLDSVCLDKVCDVLGLDNLHEVHCTDLTWVVEVAIVAPLLLGDLNLVLAALNQGSNVQDVILPLLGVIRRIRDSELLARLSTVQ
jgi:hypothetical protein